MVAQTEIEDARIFEKELPLLGDENLEGRDVEGLQIDFRVGEVGVSCEIQNEIRREAVFDVHSARKWELRVLPGLLVVTRKAIRLHDEQPAASNILNAFEVSGLRRLRNSESPPVGSPQIRLVFSADEPFEIHAPQHIRGMREVECGERNLDRCGPSIRADPSLRRPDAVPPGVEIHAGVVPLLFDDEPVHLCPERIDLKHVRSAAVVIGIDEDFKMVVEVLAHVAAQFAGDDSRRIRIEAVNSKIDRMS